MFNKYKIVPYTNPKDLKLYYIIYERCFLFFWRDICSFYDKTLGRQQTIIWTKEGALARIQEIINLKKAINEKQS